MRIVLILLWFAHSLALALEPNQKVADFSLVDHQGVNHQLYQYHHQDAVVLFVQGNGCPIVRNAMPEFQNIADQYAEQKITFLLINANYQDNTNNIRQEANEFGYQFPILVDDSQDIGKALGFERTGEVLVINPKDWTLAYRGALNNRLGYETQKVAASEHYLTDALDALIAGRPVARQKTVAKGCIINLID